MMLMMMMMMMMLMMMMMMRIARCCSRLGEESRVSRPKGQVRRCFASGYVGRGGQARATMWLIAV